MADETAATAVLHEAGWLAQWPRGFREAWLSHAQGFRAARGEVIYRDGDEGRCLYGLVRGAMAITIGPPRLSPRLINIMSPGTWFGVGPLLREGGRKMEFRAAEPSVLVRVSNPSIDQIAAQFPETRRYIGALAMYGHDVSSQVAAELLIPSSSRRIAAVVLRIAAPDPAEARVGPEGVRVTQVQLAEMANVSRNLVNSALGDLRARGWIAAHYNRLVVHDREALAAFAYGED